MSLLARSAGAFAFRRMSIDSRARSGATGAARHDPSWCASGAGAGSAATEPRSRAATGLGASGAVALRVPAGTERQRSGGPRRGWRSEHVWDNGHTSGGVPIPPLTDLPSWQAERAASLRAEARGIPARRVETAQRARQGSPVAKRRAQPFPCMLHRPSRPRRRTEATPLMPRRCCRCPRRTMR